MSSPTSSVSESWSHDFKHVLGHELECFGDRDEHPDKDAIARAYDRQLVGLAFSGGGIRSATFNLGVLQALARMKLLSKVN